MMAGIMKLTFLEEGWRQGMRIRNYRLEYLPSIVQIQQAAAKEEGTVVRSEADIANWLQELEAEVNAFVVTDDDDELNPWGQAGTLDGLEGEVAGYTVVQLRRDQSGYHFLCQGAVHPQHRRQNAGRTLLVGALNRARLLASDFEFEAEQEGVAIYFEVIFPTADPGAARLAAKCEMQPTDEAMVEGTRLYRREL
jgi:ribosomal protein S18 acetylase RimI-like enzyme